MMVTRHITNHKDIFDITEFNRLSSDIPSEKCHCQNQQKEVIRKHILSDQPPQIFGANPPVTYVFEGCCDEAIDNDLAFIKNFVANHSGNK